MFKAPWFEILAVFDLRRSMADIAAEVALKHGVLLDEIRGSTQRLHVVVARREAIGLVKKERPDLSDSMVGRYFNRERSTISKIFAKMGNAA